MAAAPPLAGAGSVVTVALFLSLLVLLLPAASQGGGGSMAGYVPVSTVVYWRSAVPAVLHEPFSQCSQCQCCPAAEEEDNGSSSCVQTWCCYGINCNIPGKPFGFCTFTLRSYGCGGAAGNCTAPATPARRLPPTSS